MKIAYVYGSTPLRHGDITDMERAVKENRDWLGDTANYVATLGHDVSIFLMHKKISGHLEYKGVKWHAYKPLITHKKLIAGKEPCMKMLKDVFESKPDIIHFQTVSYCINYAIYVRKARRSGIPIVAQYHGGRFPRHFWDRWAQGYALRNSDAAIFLTRESSEMYIQRYNLNPEKIHIIPCGFAEEFFPIDKSIVRKKTGLQGNPLIIWVAFLRKVKDPMILLRAFSNIVKKYPEARLCYIGSGEMEEPLKRAVEEDKSIQGKVTIKGFVPKDEIPSYLNSADIYVLASHVEPFAISPMEAMACGVVPILTTLPCFKIMTDSGKYGLLFEPGYQKGLEDQIEKLINDRPLIQRLSREVAKRASDYFSWKASAEKLVNLYKKVLSDRKGIK